MSNEKKTPPPPLMPPSFEIKEGFCLLHKGPLSGETYECKKCGQKYCMNCAVTAKEANISCIKCKNPIFI